MGSHGKLEEPPSDNQRTGDSFDRPTPPPTQTHPRTSSRAHGRASSLPLPMHQSKSQNRISVVTATTSSRSLVKSDKQRRQSSLSRTVSLVSDAVSNDDGDTSFLDNSRPFSRCSGTLSRANSGATLPPFKRKKTTGSDGWLVVAPSLAYAREPASLRKSRSLRSEPSFGQDNQVCPSICAHSLLSLFHGTGL